MLLVIDVGNAHTVLGLYEGDCLRAHWRVVTVDSRTEDELRILFTTLLQHEGIDPQSFTGCCTVSVPGTSGCWNRWCSPFTRTNLQLSIFNRSMIFWLFLSIAIHLFYT